MRVVHPKLSDRTILGCYQLLEAKGLAVAGKPMTTVITTVLTSLIDNMQSQGVIPDMVDGDAEGKLNAIIGDVGKVELPTKSLSINPLGDVDESLLNDEDKPLLEKEIRSNNIEDSYQEDDETEEQLPDSILTGVRDIYDPLPITENGTDSPEPEPEPIEVRNEIPPWEIIPNMKTFAEIEKECPLDRFVEVANQKDNDILRHTVEIVYHTLPLIDWGSTKAEQLIRETIPIVSKYVK